jgi:peptidoglycan/LPS O-acetylase OafA/YrhL/TPR repeat protein
MSYSLNEPIINESIYRRKYLLHIDGLRALAIIGVLLYHFCPKLCPGGYTGVDVFFVISGYLITGGILKDITSGEFSIKIFYIRRIKRIMPAYFLVLLTVLLSSAYFIPRLYLKSIFDASLWSLFDGANFYFYKFVNYFTLAAKNNPLLHLWSLGVEEQFYLLIPILVLLLYPKKHRKLIILLITIFGLSLVCSIITVSSKSFLHSADFAFYMLPSRAWELLSGSLLAYFGLKFFKLNFKNSWLEYSGLICIIIPYLLYNDEMPFPGLAAIPPILGAVLLIMSGSNILSARPFVFIGKISYSLYLWHWPIYVFWVATDPTPLRVFLGLLISFFVSLLSWFLIENKIRKNQSVSNNAVLGYFAMITIFTLLLILTLKIFLPNDINKIAENKTSLNGAFETIVLSSGIKKKTPDEWQDENNPTKLEDLITKSDVELTVIGTNQMNPRFILWGDSHALALLPGLDLATKKYKYAGLYINKIHKFVGPRRKEYIDSEKAVSEWLYKHKEITEVIIAQHWARYLRNENDSLDFINLCRYLKSIGKKIIIFSDCPETTMEINYLLNSNTSFDSSKIYMSKSQYDSRETYMYKLFDNLTTAKLVNIINLQDAFYNGSGYDVFIRLSNHYESFFYDKDHLNLLGSTYAAQFYGSLLDEYFQDKLSQNSSYKNNLAESRNNQSKVTDTLVDTLDQAKSGYSFAQYKLGLMYRDGINVKKDIKEAAKWFLISADRGNAQALTAYNLIKNKISNVELFNNIKELAELGFEEEQYRLGIMYRDGINVKKDINEAIKWFLRCADEGNPEAAVQLGIIYHYDITLRNYSKAQDYMLLAHKILFGDAAYYLGLWYHNGEGVHKDVVKTISFWESALASGGWVQLNINIGDIYFSGNAVNKNLVLAEKYWLKAARNGLPDAMYRLGILYYDPTNNMYNLPKAYMWLKSGSLNGSKQSADICLKIESGMNLSQLADFNKKVDLERIKVGGLK